jgi:hypothetical protein
MVNFAQLNMGKSKDADRELQNFIIENNIDLLFLQEPSLSTKNKIKAGKFYTNTISLARSRTAIWISNTKNLRSPLLLNHLSNSDTTTLSLEIHAENQWKNIIISSIYMP